MKLTLVVESQNIATIRTAVCQAYLALTAFEASGEVEKLKRKLKCCGEKCGSVEFEV